MAKRSRQQSARRPSVTARAGISRAPEVHPYHERVHRKHKHREPTVAAYAERLPHGGFAWKRTLVAALVACVIIGASVMQSPRVLRVLPDRFVSAADAAGLVPLMPWTPSADAELARFESERLTPLTPDAPLPLGPDDVVREVILQRTKLPVATALRVADTISKEARALGVDPLIVLAIIDVESKYDHLALSYRGARGLMQLMPDTRAWFVEKTPELWDETDRDDTLDPASNVRVGVHYFAHLTRGFRGLEHILQAYNCGPARLLAILKGESVLPEESKYFADRVQKSYHKLQRDYAHVWAQGTRRHR